MDSPLLDFDGCNTSLELLHGSARAQHIVRDEEKLEGRDTKCFYFIYVYNFVYYY